MSNDVEQLASSVFIAVKAYIVKHIARLAKRIEQLEQRPEPDLSKFAQRGCYDAAIDDVVSKLGEVSGAVAAMGETYRKLIEAVDARIDALPPPEKGADADMTEVRALVETAAKASADAAADLARKMVTDAIAAVDKRIDELPAPGVAADDVSASMELASNAQADLVRASLATLRDTLSAQFKEAIDGAVAGVDARIAALPKPQDGKDADMDEVRAAIAASEARSVSLEQLENAIAASRESLSSELGVALVANVQEMRNLIADIPPPEKVDLGALAASIVVASEASSEEIRAAVASVREDVEQLVAGVSQRIDGLPVPQNGKDFDPAALAAIDERVEQLSATVETVRKLASEEPTGTAAAECANTVVSGLEALASQVAELKQAPASPSSFVIDAEGDMVAVYPDGSTKAVGRARGKDGNRGASVMDGSIDDAGALTLRMSDGRVVNVGRVRGEPGKPGDPGVGKPGRDALELGVQVGLDESRSYPANSCFAYRGGTVLSVRVTDPIDGVDDIAKAGWRVLLDGVAEETEEALDDGRFVERTTVYTSGRRFARRETTSTMIYRGVHAAERLYKKGDLVTWNGSLWHAERPTKSKPPSDDWKLVAKAGRDAHPRDGK
jgi:hypothetical protein